MRSFLLFCLAFWCLPAVAQQQEGGKAPQQRLHQLEARMAKARDQFRAARNDSGRVAANTRFEKLLDSALAMPESRAWPFDSLVGTMAVIESPDNAFRVFNWNLPADDGTHEFFARFQMSDAETGAYRVETCRDLSWSIERPLNKQLGTDKWYGALYYEIIAIDLGKDKRVYTLLGWDGNNKVTQKKVLESLEVLPNGDLRFGVALFKIESKTQKRVIFEYSSDASMSLRYNARRKEIVFDHLAPRSPELQGMYQFYGPDMSFDAFKLKKGKWEFKRDVDARNTNNDRPWNKPE